MNDDSFGLTAPWGGHALCLWVRIGLLRPLGNPWSASGAAAGLFCLCSGVGDRRARSGVDLPAVRDAFELVFTSFGEAEA